MKKLLLLLVSAALFTACQKDNDKIKANANALTFEDERNIGYYLDIYYTNKTDDNTDRYWLLQDDYATTYDYLNKVKNKILVTNFINNIDNYNWNFRIFSQTNIENAFVFPGGYIYLSTGLLKQLDNEAQLMALLSGLMSNIDQQAITQKLEARFTRNFLVDVALGGNSDAMGDLLQESSQISYDTATVHTLEQNVQHILCAADYNIQYYSTFLLNSHADSEWLQLFPSYPNRDAVLHYAQDADGCLGSQTNEQEYADWKSVLP